MVQTHKDNVEIDFERSYRKFRVYETNTCVEETQNLVPDKAFPLGYLLLHQLKLTKHLTKVFYFHRKIYRPDQRSHLHSQDEV